MSNKQYTTVYVSEGKPSDDANINKDIEKENLNIE
jgi:hypothetical protein